MEPTPGRARAPTRTKRTDGIVPLLLGIATFGRKLAGEFAEGERITGVNGLLIG